MLFFAALAVGTAWTPSPVIAAELLQGGAGMAAAISTYSYHPEGERDVGTVISVWGTRDRVGTSAHTCSRNSGPTFAANITRIRIIRRTVEDLRVHDSAQHPGHDCSQQTDCHRTLSVRLNAFPIQARERHS